MSLRLMRKLCMMVWNPTYVMRFMAKDFWFSRKG